jgi:hypothetical protein
MVRDIMVTPKISKRKRMRSKMFLKRNVPFLIISTIVILGGLLAIGRLLDGHPREGALQWIWFIGVFLLSQFVYLRYIVEK